MSILQKLVVVTLFGLFAIMLARLNGFQPGQQTELERQTLPSTAQSRSFTGIYEPSGLVHLGQGQFILIEDEPDHPFHLLELAAGQNLSELGEIGFRGEATRLNDLEGIAFDGHFVYAITSHSLTKKGKQGQGRSILLRAQYREGKLRADGMVTDLKPYLIKLLKNSYPELTKKQIRKQLNVEALSVSSDAQSLYIGLRAPVIEGRSLVVRIAEPAAMFKQGSAVDVQADLMALDLGGVGIRAMCRAPGGKAVLLVAGDKKKGGGEFSVWQWSGEVDNLPQKIQQVDKGTEGLLRVELPEFTGRILLQDDGKRNKGRPAHYQFIQDRLPASP